MKDKHGEKARIQRTYKIKFKFFKTTMEGIRLRIINKNQIILSDTQTEKSGSYKISLFYYPEIILSIPHFRQQIL